MVSYRGLPQASTLGTKTKELITFLELKQWFSPPAEQPRLKLYKNGTCLPDRVTLKGEAEVVWKNILWSVSFAFCVVTTSVVSQWFRCQWGGKTPQVFTASHTLVSLILNKISPIQMRREGKTMFSRASFSLDPPGLGRWLAGLSFWTLICHMWHRTFESFCRHSKSLLLVSSYACKVWHEVLTGIWTETTADDLCV